MSDGFATFSDLFCGIGGFHYAATSLGLRLAFACDIDAGASAQYRRNFGVEPAGDITRIAVADVPDHDLLLAGFPCQPFSIIGRRDGLADERGALVYEVARILKGKRPRAFVLENVRQLQSIHGGRAMAAVVTCLGNAGYACRHRVLNALDFGLPQKRERVMIVGFRDGWPARFEWPQGTAERRPLAEILEPAPDRRHFASDHIRAARRAKHSAATTPSIWHENKGGHVSSHPFSCALRAAASYNYLLVNGERRLTPREQLRLQGFPERFEVIGSDSQVRKQAGNAVPVPMARAVIEKVLDAAGRAAGAPAQAA